jgi:glycosyltransferase involved in cell wall biosynthesis
MDSGLPYVVSIQGLMHKLTEAFPCDPYFSLRIPMERTVLERGTHFVVKTPFARAFMEEHFPGKKLHDLENPMHEAFFDVPQKKEMGHRLIFVGAVMRTKGIEELLAVMDRHPDWFLSIVGGGVGSYVESLKKKDAQLLNVAWKGMLSSEAIAELMQEHDALVLPSYMDTSPNVVSEAMCAGLPVVATRVGGIPDMVSDGRTGFLVEAKSVTSLDEGLQKLFLNPQKALQMGVEGRKEGHRRFAPELAAKKVFEIYRSVLGENEHA